MSSREFIVLLEFLDDESPYKTFAPKPFGRDGDWPEARKIAAETHKEFALYRASKYVGGSNEYVPQVFLSPGERLAAFLEAQEEREAAMDLENLLSNALDR
jgi:hypothetical protein